METTIDKPGRVVAPKSMRDRVVMGPGEVDLTADGSGVRIESIATDGLEEVDGRLVIPASGRVITDEMVRSLRDADQR